MTSRVIGVPGTIWYFGSFHVRSGLITCHVTPSSRRLVDDVRGLVDGLRIVLRDEDDGLAREAVLDVLRMVTVAVLRIDPAALRLARSRG